MRRFKTVLALPLSLLAAEPLPKTVEKVCTKCHPASVFTSKRQTRAEWADIVSEMKNYGAKGTRAEFQQVIDYLAKAFPADPARKPPAAPRPNIPR